jgi:hypothetical protein
MMSDHDWWMARTTSLRSAPDREPYDRPEDAAEYRHGGELSTEAMPS